MTPNPDARAREARSAAATHDGWRWRSSAGGASASCLRRGVRLAVVDVARARPDAPWTWVPWRATAVLVHAGTTWTLVSDHATERAAKRAAARMATLLARRRS